MAVPIDVQRLNAWFGSTQALYDININVPAREVTAIIGPSGCGKSTLVRCLNRMHETNPDARVEGAVRIGGVNVYSRHTSPVEVRRRVGMVFQKPNPFPKSVFDNIAYGPRIHGSRSRSELAEIVERSLMRAALWEEVKDRLQDNALGLSGGQQQRLCIARALANDPEVLLLDEPTASLDPAGTAHIEELVQQLKREFTVVIVTHNLQQAARVSDVTAFFYLGELVEVGPTSRIFTAPLQERTEAYVTGRFG